MTAPQDRVIVALDVPTLDEARALVSTLEGNVGVYKIGLELLVAGGLELARELIYRGDRVFIDAKFYDIPNTVERATARVATLGASFLTIHSGGSQCMRAAVRGRGESDLKLLAVTVLTHMGPADLAEMGMPTDPQALVLQRAQMAQETGFDGVIASGHEAAHIREALGPDFLIITPGIRPEGSAKGDQTRVMTPAEALGAGADLLVIGRPITAAPDPGAAAEAIISEMTS